MCLGWSAPPETFQAPKSMIEVADERAQCVKKFKNQKVPKQQDFPTLGGAKGAPAAGPGFWGVPGNSIPKSAKNNKKNNKKGNNDQPSLTHYQVTAPFVVQFDTPTFIVKIDTPIFVVQFDTPTFWEDEC